MIRKIIPDIGNEDKRRRRCRVMLKTYAVVFQNQRTGKVKMDTFSEIDERAARHAFRECYRHENYKILATVEVPEPA